MSKSSEEDERIAGLIEMRGRLIKATIKAAEKAKDTPDGPEFALDFYFYMNKFIEIQRMINPDYGNSRKT